MDKEKILEQLNKKLMPKPKICAFILGYSGKSLNGFFKLLASCAPQISGE